MWNVTGTNLQMAEGDYGIALPVTISGTTLTENDSIRFTFKNSPNGETILTKEYTEISQNTVQLVLSEAEIDSLQSMHGFRGGDVILFYAC